MFCRIHKVIEVCFPRLRRALVRARLGALPFGVVSNNCWGSHIYQAAEWQYMTPFVGLFLSPTAYVYLLTNWSRLIDSRLQFTDRSCENWIEDIRQEWKPAWPVGVLGGEVEIQFMHYETHEEAQSKWERRLNRMPRDLARLFFKFDDRAGCTVGQMNTFSELQLPNRVLFVADRRFEKLACAVYIPSAEVAVPDGLALSRISPKYFDSAAWIAGKPQPYLKLLSFI